MKYIAYIILFSLNFCGSYWVFKRISESNPEMLFALGVFAGSFLFLLFGVLIVLFLEKKGGCANCGDIMEHLDKNNLCPSCSDHFKK